MGHLLFLDFLSLLTVKNTTDNDNGNANTTDTDTGTDNTTDHYNGNA